MYYVHTYIFFASDLNFLEGLMDIYLIPDNTIHLVINMQCKIILTIYRSYGLFLINKNPIKVNKLERFFTFA